MSAEEVAERPSSARLATIVTYDRRMGDAAKALGLTVAAPA
jgi:hypothetical protein